MLICKIPLYLANADRWFKLSFWRSLIPLRSIRNDPSNYGVIGAGSSGKAAASGPLLLMETPSF